MSMSAKYGSFVFSDFYQTKLQDDDDKNHAMLDV